ncbi:MAG: hypothetical protein U5L02_00755, partial [Rheinheimera sp.]|nr:hypothetical protein [Rheinheimera sp.]
KIANPANTKAQALCNGGASTGPHQHWSLKQNGSWVHLNTVYLSGWQITATGSSYDTNCSRFYLSKNGVKKCSGFLITDSESDNRTQKRPEIFQAFLLQ